MNPSYLFTTPRLGLRLWRTEDLTPFSEINADPETMRFFQNTYSIEDTLEMMNRMQRTFDERGYCYFAVDHLESKELIGTIGLGWKTFESDFSPCVDIGWRIEKKWWNQGLTTEGASACLEYARKLQIPEVLSFASVNNTASIKVMQKIGMNYWKDFDHPELALTPHIQRCSLYRIRLDS